MVWPAGREENIARQEIVVEGSACLQPVGALWPWVSLGMVLRLCSGDP